LFSLFAALSDMGTNTVGGLSLASFAKLFAAG
jgi:hypothetical protein